ncbi:MAG TPA: hypothetical protein VM056_01550 [Terriglobales bacterium]|nr:hypothetical protein [Terriglobales bacterium]
MPTNLDRRSFLAFSTAVAGTGILPTFLTAQTPAPVVTPAATPAEAQASAPKRVKPDALKPELVKEFVGAAHGNLEKTKSMLAETPGLLNATWDWGGGDFEKAIGGAGHMGRADIANFLITQGANLDIYVAAMLGKLEIVQAAISAYPNLAESKGPHGITLMVHAQKGGENSASVVKYLESLEK